ncbi:MAG: hypothetical protein AAGD32_08330 [Planctomycetota bacterium]
MDFIKKFGLYIVFGLIAIASIVAGLFYPLPGMLASLQGEVETRANLDSDLSSLLNKSRSLPDISIDGDEPEELTVFPTEANYNLGVEAVENFSQSADQVISLIDAINAKRPLVDGALPLELGEPNRIVLLQGFQRTYQRRMNANGDTPESSLVANPLQGTFPLDSDELDREAERIESVLRQRIQFDAAGQAINEDEVMAQIDEQLEALADRLVARKAQTAKLYVSPDAFEVSQSMTADTAPTNIDVFYAQVALWAQEEIAGAIADANADATNILDAPVKHLLRVEVDANALGGLESGRGSNQRNTPTDVDYPADPAATIEPDYTVSLTGRKSNSFYEVVPFTVRMRVDATEVPAVLAAFSDNRLLSVLNITSMEVIDNGLAKSQSFLYGDAPVVELEVEGEALMLRSWLASYVPKAVQAAIMNVEEESDRGNFGFPGGANFGGFEGYGGEFGGF